eukprot:CAMPEP_0202961634 /NCGR_PEP_ID=MMETSP1396-20130829/5705_1 /ASSEMBLY_ACC=CAM_ASM_000872 /TAXON_ID= /ORGANISM="Pseudokeronopsis sp., Strain Brazil" /LENGTH=274 /DNA_ID=CAMNT_0049681613 /DNA_START=22 /DNA_END=846 /DNA_ORIENTATION=+
MAATQIFQLGERPLQQIALYLHPSELCNFSQISKQFNQSAVTEDAWENLSKLRWHVSDRAKKSLLVASWKDVYRMLNLRNQIPEGKFSGKLMNIFAHGSKLHSASAWVMIGHGNSALLRSVQHENREWNVIEVRLCFQNLSQSNICLPLGPESIRMTAFHSDELVNDELLTSNYRMLAFNGNRMDKSAGVNEVYLKPYEFVVISFSSFCPLSVDNEPDFLTMIERFSVLFTKEEGMTLDSVNLNRISDEAIWNMYSTLPSGVVLLKERPMISAV